jgi:hypothetical protein
LFAGNQFSATGKQFIGHALPSEAGRAAFPHQVQHSALARVDRQGASVYGERSRERGDESLSCFISG